MLQTAQKITTPLPPELPQERKWVETITNGTTEEEENKSPPNNKQRSAEGLMHITNSLTVQQEEFAQLKYSDVQPFAAVGLSEAQRSGSKHPT